MVLFRMDLFLRFLKKIKIKKKYHKILCDIYLEHNNDLDKNNNSFDTDENTESELTENDENYIIKAIVNKPLAKILNIAVDETNDNKNFVWKPPSKSGLSNSNYIIPTYYQTNNNKILDISYYEIIKDDIKNYRKLNTYQLNYVLN